MTTSDDIERIRAAHERGAAVAGRRDVHALLTALDEANERISRLSEQADPELMVERNLYALRAESHEDCAKHFHERWKAAEAKLARIRALLEES